MNIDILTLFPKMFEGVLSESMLKIAARKKKISVKVHNLRDWTSDRHRTADDKPFGGGAGMVMMVEPIYRALLALAGEKAIKKIMAKKSPGKNIKIILLTPKGRPFNQKMARTFSKAKRMILICGHYEGVDERVRRLVTEEVSVGDYVLTGGEIPAMAVLDATARLMPGVLGGSESLKCESFEDGLLEYPHYTRPREFENMAVPDVLLRGDHKKIIAWRENEALNTTRERRKDLIK